eukprot:1539961-Pleurochrysis_carterae.AAC.2
MLASFPTSERARLQCIRPRCVASSCASAVKARNSVRLPPGHRSRPPRTSTLMPSAVTGSPTTILAGASCRPSSLKPSAVSFACLHARDVARAPQLPPATVCTPGRYGSLRCTPGGSPRSIGPPPLSHRYSTWIYRGSVCPASSPRQPTPCARLRLSRQACAACGGGYASSNAACFPRVTLPPALRHAQNGSARTRP